MGSNKPHHMKLFYRTYDWSAHVIAFPLRFQMVCKINVLWPLLSLFMFLLLLRLNIIFKTPIKIKIMSKWIKVCVTEVSLARKIKKHIRIKVSHTSNDRALNSFKHPCVLSSVCLIFFNLSRHEFWTLSSALFLYKITVKK